MSGNLPQLKQILKTDAVQAQFQGMLKDRASAFITSVITTVSNNGNLQKASPTSIILCAATSASLNLPVNPALGYAAIIPYGNTAQLQIMVDGWVALAKRGGQLEVLTCEPVYEGELLTKDRFHERYDFLDSGCEDESKIIGFMCYMEEINGFHKTIYWSKEKVMAHGKQYSKNFNNSSSLWKTNFPAMARKTLVKHMLKKYGTLSTDMQTAIERDERNLKGEIQDVNNAQIDEEEYNDVVENSEASVVEVKEEEVVKADEAPKTTPKEEVKLSTKVKKDSKELFNEASNPTW